MEMLFSPSSPSLSCSPFVPPFPTQVIKAFRRAVQELIDLEGMGLEACIIMHRYLRKRGVESKLVRRRLPNWSDHWTVVVDSVEYDPTIGFCSWSDTDVFRATVTRNTMNIVTNDSPHKEWKELEVDEKEAYYMAGVSYKGLY